MSCAFCVHRVERALAGTAGLQAAHVNLATQRATVTWDPAVTGGAAMAAPWRRPATA